MSAIKVNLSGDAWCTLEIGFETAPDYSFFSCGGLEKIIVYCPNVSFNYEAFTMSTNLLEVNCAGQGSIKRILDDNFYYSQKITVFNLTADIELITDGVFDFAKDYPFMPSNGFLIGGTTKLVLSFNKNHNLVDFKFDGITRLHTLHWQFI